MPKKTRKTAIEEQRKAAIQALFQSMLHQLMTGQVRCLRYTPDRRKGTSRRPGDREEH